ncbi:uncharacterized protein BDCG_01046 [Blastomyces dermatitidis ER-3]|uniref:Uncharacterized protein n=3 Tax=Blastomyces TaxID=229219 RepID=A0A179UFU1_BLAGS|nr:uncharacterized protein BDBG_16723 [Blastomyces gilchristii SLH14081]XP_045272257.1 uncharacterized protein BDCG_01046 [Blastomyces dermatitidis ER-3]EGE86772.2 hypothetical protein BDDG_09722 [Blastomyces dermatitidis ATCC 18188]EQL28448.1 hypothetical protein BDFG_08808 [Blastomyces dermatitidis ATCC 26199]EEQ84241.2 hypothetical protein BDCG_01046 [Blastomyces dermatitidis ER-3]OAT06844.1 hypothetical protein BDBG_16723 [Blastomyces gilchristii SLH14081]
MSALGFRYRDAFSSSISRKEVPETPKLPTCPMTRVGIPALNNPIPGGEGSNFPTVMEAY